MKKQNDDEQINHEKSKLQKILGYDEANLIRTARDAMQQSKEESENPEKNTETDEELDLKFELLMLRLNSEGKKPIDQETYDKRRKWENQESFDVKRHKKTFVLAALACVLLLGPSISVIGKSSYGHTLYPDTKNRNILIRHNTTINTRLDSLDNAYNQTGQYLDIPVLILNYIPEGMDFYDFEIDDIHSLIRFQYNGKYILLKENKLLNDSSIVSIESDRNISESIYNKWLDDDLNVEENLLKNGEIEYSVTIENENASYYFAGIMEKDEFIKIVESLIYL